MSSVLRWGDRRAYSRPRSYSASSAPNYSSVGEERRLLVYGYAAPAREKIFFQIRGSKPERWVSQTDFSNDEAVGYLADRLNILGVEKALMKAGAHAGDMVVIGTEEDGMIFDWEPTMGTGAELLSPRGTDIRLDEVSRPTRRERKSQYYEMMDAKEAARQELWMERQAGVWTEPDDHIED